MESHPGKISQVTTWLIVVNPFTKFALTAYPLNKSMEDMLLPTNRGPVCTMILSRIIRTVIAVLIAVSNPPIV